MALCPALTDDDLAEWISALRGRLARGDLAMLAPVDVGYGTGTQRTERTIRIMLTDLDSFDTPVGPSDDDAAWRAARRGALLDDFRQLRELIS